MPAVRTVKGLQLSPSPPTKHNARNKAMSTVHTTPVAAEGDEVVDLAQCDMIYPQDDESRRMFRTKKGKKLTTHQWAIYDYARKVPVGKVSTYKNICVALGEGSPRSVGTALRNNPFAPFVPCHRVIASDHYIGGFRGEWGPNSRTGTHCNQKISMLAKEGVAFDERGYLRDGDSAIWRE
ncbi:DNA binding methylated-DNA--cysteine S-methyltransferase [Ramaria rubella]|nr:DNA binding methylated-DNA--cysteine S-methyltransferase [Ramaria rubella]